MKLLKVGLKNFRCFEELTVEFAEEHNVHVIIAENMVGKSAFLNALRIASREFLGRLDVKSLPSIEIEDHRISGSNPMSDLVRETKLDYSLQFSLPPDEEKIVHWDYSHELSSFSSGFIGFQEHAEVTGVTKIAAILYDSVVEKKKGCLPLIQFTGTEYVNAKLPEEESEERQGSVFHGYWECLSLKSMKDFVFNWLYYVEKIKELSSNNEVEKARWQGFPDYFSFIRKIIIQLLSDEDNPSALDIIDVNWIEKPDAIQHEIETGEKRAIKERKVLGFKLRNQQFRLFDQLSDGYQYLVLLAGELAVRSLLLNKHLGLETNDKIPGVVLIDEFGVHLHPELQEKVLKRLSNTFPKVQFIVTTHSPLMLNGLKKEQVHILEMDSETGKRTIRHPERDIIGLGAEGILIQIFGLDTTFDIYTHKAKKRFIELSQKDRTTGLSDDERKEFGELGQQLGPVSFDPSLYDPLYTEFLKRYQQRLKQKPRPDQKSEQETEALMDEVMEELFQEWEQAN